MEDPRLWMLSQASRKSRIVSPSPVVTVGLFVGPLLVGWMADVTGSYTMPFELCALIALVGSTASFLCVVPQPAEIALVSQPSGSTSPV